MSFYRLLVFPFILYLVISEQEKLFSLFLIINLITDILDGFIARNFNQQTKLGARLDSLADIGTYILAFSGIFQFKTEEIGETISLLWVFLGFYAFVHLVAQIKFRKWPSLHLYSVKFSGYAQGIFFFVLFTIGFIPWLFYLAMGIGFAAWMEELIVIIIIPELKSDMKGMYWLLKKKRI